MPRLLEHPADVVVARDEPATLRCEATGEPEPEVKWVKDGVEVRTAPADPASHRVLLPLPLVRVLQRGRRGRVQESQAGYCELVSRRKQFLTCKVFPF